MKRFPKDARVCFLGDSITHGNNFVTRIIAYYQKHFPEDHVKFWNCGVSGGSAGSGLLYLEDDLLRHNPTHVAIMLGVNDSCRTELDKPDSPEKTAVLDGALSGYTEKMNRLCDILREHNIEVILCTPAPYAEFYETGDHPLPGGHALILRYAETVRKLAHERNLDVVDYHARLSELYLDEALFNPDHVHPNDKGHYRMAECFLRAQGLWADEYQSIDDVIRDAGLDEWHTLVGKLRDLYAGEWMIVCNYSLSFEEKMKAAKEYIEQEKWGDFLYFKNLSKTYYENKPKEAEIAARIDAITEANFR